MTEVEVGTQNSGIFVYAKPFSGVSSLMVVRGRVCLTVLELSTRRTSGSGPVRILLERGIPSDPSDRHEVYLVF